MKIEKLSSGSYRIRKMYKGKTYTVITEYKPTQKEATKLISEAMESETTSTAHMTFKQAAEKYIESKKDVISPSTVNGYKSILRNLSDRFKNSLISDLDQFSIQTEISKYSKGRSPKTVRNAHGFISAVFSVFRPSFNLATTLPQKDPEKAYIPSDEDVKRILQRAKGTIYEIPLLLATFGLRRSEICALTPEDLDGNMLTINKALVTNDSGEFVIKKTKTTAGTRTVYIPDYLANLIREKKVIYNKSPNQIYENLCRYQEELGIPHFGLHKLRHYYASASHSLGIPDSYIMQAGGWKSDSTLKNVYRHAMESKVEEMQKFTAEYLEDLLTDD